MATALLVPMEGAEVPVADSAASAIVAIAGGDHRCQLPLRDVLVGGASPAEDEARSFVDRARSAAAVARRPSPMAAGQFGLFATRPIAEGQVLFEERPWLASQLTRNRHEVLACSACLAVAGSLEQQADLAAGHTSPAEAGAQPASWTLPWSPKGRAASPPASVRKCACGETFCSDGCREDSGHPLLCVAQLPEEGAEDSALFRFKAHAVRTNELYLFAAKAISQMACVLRTETASPGSSGAEWHRLPSLVSFLAMLGEPWWEFARPPADEPCGSLEDYRAGVRREALESLGLLREALSLDASPEVDALRRAGALEPRFWGSLLGSFQINNFGILCDSPLRRALASLAREVSRERAGRRVARRRVAGRRGRGRGSDSNAAEVAADAPEACKAEGATAEAGRGQGGVSDGTAAEVAADAGGSKAEAALRLLSERLAGAGAIDLLSAEEDVCPPLDGIGVFPLLATVNHSCDPNARVCFSATTSGAVASLVALRTIAVDEEIVHAYIERGLPAVARAKRLREEYGFDCKCSRCSQCCRPPAVARRRVK